ncbi:L,D-transpeptidase family protein [Halomonas litopenaei]|uniref:L,D-transpeptidase family protein n=1 Tax=Halomonas litopenaei TaxID=2109328 RepID=UPI000C5687E6|nr:hypothetical protein [Halomonas sp.]
MTSTSLRRPLVRLATLCGVVGALAAPLAAADDLPRGHYLLPEEGDLIGEVYTVEADEEDTLIDIGHEHGIGFNAITRANPDISIWYPGEGTEVTIPAQFILPDAPRNGIVVNVAEMRLYYYPPAKEGEPRTVQTYPIAVGRMDWKTPLGSTTITQMVKNPSWYPPASIRREHAEAGDPLPGVVPPGPDNPMGTRKMRLGIPGYLIHGTNKPEGVGMRVTHGCIRMLPDDVENLFDQVAVGTRVRLVNEPLKLGWSDEHLYVQAYPYLDEEEGAPIEDMTAAIEEVEAAVKDKDYDVDFARLRSAMETPSGLPVAMQPTTPAEPKPLPGSLYDHIELIADEPALLGQVSHEG